MRNTISITVIFIACITTSCIPLISSIPSENFPTATLTTTTFESTSSVLLSQMQKTFVVAYQDVRAEDLQEFENFGESLIKTLWFDQSTLWSIQDQQVARNILIQGTDPGLGIRELHQKGITGKGIKVAIIDQDMVLDHPEFQGKISKYYDVDGINHHSNTGSMHGSAVTSLLVGNQIGTAPDAVVYYAAVPSWLGDAQYYADALDWIIDENKKLPEGEKIRVVSVSAAPSGIWSEFLRNNETWDAAFARAMEAGILVLDCTFEHGITLACTSDLNNPNNIASCIPNWNPPPHSPKERINVPTSRTTATQEKNNGKITFSYQFTGNGGMSWTTPYLAGVLAMGWQLNPDLTNSQILHLLYDSAYVTESGEKILDPTAFIKAVKLTINEK